VLGGDWTADASIFYGHTESYVESYDIDITLNEMRGFTVLVNYDWLNLYTTYFGVDISGASAFTQAAFECADPLTCPSTLINGLMQLNVDAGFDIRNLESYQKYAYKDANQTDYFGVGVNGDLGSFYFGTEVTFTDVEASITQGTTLSGYVYGGVRLTDTLQLTLTASHQRKEQNDDVAEDFADEMFSIYSPLDPFVQQAVGIYTATIDQVQESETDAYTITTRWDFHRKAAAKLEYTRYDYGHPDSDKLQPYYVKFGVDLVF
jgi:hypothetical protein